MESKRIIIAVALSIGIWILWMQFFGKPVPENKETVTQKENTVTTQPVKDTKPEIKVIAPKIVNETTIDIATDKYQVSFSNKGGVIKSIKYKERNVELIVPNKKFNAKGVFDFSIFLSKDEFAQGNSLDSIIWNHVKPANNVIKFVTTLSLDGKPVQLEKIFTFNKDSYYFKIDYNLINLGNTSVSFPNGYIIVSPSDFLGPDMDFENTHNRLSQIYYLNNEFEKCEKGGGFFSGNESFKIDNGEIGWAGVMSRYFLLIMLPENFKGTGVICDKREHNGFKAGIYINADKIQPGKKLAKSFKVYVGEKNKEKLAAVDITLKDAADVSKWIEPIRDLLLWCLMKINSVIGNFGWSLVIFSILSKVLLLPLTAKSTASMKKMQALAPKMNELKEKYKGKPDVLNKEIMKMYKTNKVNPMGGCLPMLLQMPFFFALWSALINSIDLWQAPFIFWIKDLSLPDTVFNVAQIIPSFSFNVNILPIIMTATSFIQQRLMPTAGGSTQQQKVMMFMPLIFIVIFWDMPSGLVLYWTLQNVMQILHQLYTERKTVKEA